MNVSGGTWPVGTDELALRLAEREQVARWL